MIIFKNPINNKYELGKIIHKYKIKEDIFYDVISESGKQYVNLSDKKNNKGYIDFKLSNMYNKK